MKRLLLLILVIPSVSVADPSGINWRDGTRLTAGMLQQFDNAKVNTVNGTRFGGTDNGTDLKMGVAKSLQSGSVARTLAEYFSDTINVRNFGAKCDVGTSPTPTDDTQAIQAAFTAAQALDHVRVILPGMCEITSTINTTVGNHLAIQGGGLYVNGLQPVDGVNITIQGKGKFDISSVRFRPGPNGAGRALTIIGNGGNIADNSDFIQDVTITTSNEKMDGSGFSNGIYLYGIVAYINNLSVTFPQSIILNGKQTQIDYDDPNFAVGITFAGTPKDAGQALNGGGSLITNMQSNGGFSSIRFVGMFQGGVFTNIVSNWQTHITYAGTDVVSPQTFTFINETSQSGFWSTPDSSLFDFEAPAGQIIIDGGLYNGPNGPGHWTVLKCHGCGVVQFNNNQVNQGYASASPLLDSGPAGSGAYGWVVQNNSFGAPITANSAAATTDTLNFGGLKSYSELTFTNNVLGLLPPLIMPTLSSGAGKNLANIVGNTGNNTIRGVSSKGMPSMNMEQGILTTNWSVKTKLYGSGIPVPQGVIPLTLNGATNDATNSISTLRPFNSIGSLVSVTGVVSCYEWAESPAKHYGIYRINAAFGIKPGTTDIYTLLGSSTSSESALYTSNGESFTPRFVLSGGSPVLQVVNSGTAASTLTCSADISIANLQ